MSLVDLVARFETARRYAPRGAYAGITHDRERAAGFAVYYLGDESAHGAVWLLGCDCGEAGFWPLEATVTVEGDAVTWSGFCQPHRPRWRYDGFGPFVFAQEQYRAAADRAAAAIRR